MKIVLGSDGSIELTRGEHITRGQDKSRQVFVEWAESVSPIDTGQFLADNMVVEMCITRPDGEQSGCLLVNFVFQKNNKKEFSIKDKNAYYNVYLKEYKDIYLDSYREMLMLKPNEMKITNGLWLTAQKMLHVGLAEKKKNLKNLFLNILNKAKELKIQWVGIPCVLEKYCGISPKTMFKIALKSVKEWIIQNENYNMEVLFCCPNEKLYKKFKKIYSKKIEQRSSN